MFRSASWQCDLCLFFSPLWFAIIWASITKKKEKRKRKKSASAQHTKTPERSTHLCTLCEQIGPWRRQNEGGGSGAPMAEVVKAEKAAASQAVNQHDLNGRGGTGLSSEGLPHHMCCGWRDQLLSLKRDCRD